MCNNKAQFLNVEVDGVFGDEDEITVGADYYFDPTFRLEATYHIQDDAKDDVDFFSIHSQYFINSNFAVGGEVSFGDDVQVFNINATYGF
ncbi:hypothetical protein ACBQ24_07545 [Acinetobacter terrestris]|uniref:hypothetical protein n=1 Tax=Acinetobacter terrestris TaxID=2529843 RepID=UPI00352396DA